MKDTNAQTCCERNEHKGLKKKKENVLDISI